MCKIEKQTPTPAGGWTEYMDRGATHGGRV
jgi:hypothetical protein